MSDKLYEHRVHTHEPKNINFIHAELNQSWNNKIAVQLTKRVGSMWTAYLFVVLAFVGLLSILGVLPPIVVLLVTWLSQTFIQLVLLPVIMVSQNVLSRHQEIQADEMFETTQHSFHDIGQIVEHLHVQDEKIVQIKLLLEEVKSTFTREGV